MLLEVALTRGEGVLEAPHSLATSLQRSARGAVAEGPPGQQGFCRIQAAPRARRARSARPWRARATPAALRPSRPSGLAAATWRMARRRGPRLRASRRAEDRDIYGGAPRAPPRAKLVGAPTTLSHLRSPSWYVGQLAPSPQVASSTPRRAHTSSWASALTSRLRAATPLTRQQRQRSPPEWPRSGNGNLCQQPGQRA